MSTRPGSVLLLIVTLVGLGSGALLATSLYPIDETKDDNAWRCALALTFPVCALVALLCFACSTKRLANKSCAAELLRISERRLDAERERIEALEKKLKDMVTECFQLGEQNESLKAENEALKAELESRPEGLRELVEQLRDDVLLDLRDVLVVATQQYVAMTDQVHDTLTGVEEVVQQIEAWRVKLAQPESVHGADGFELPDTAGAFFGTADARETDARFKKLMLLVHPDRFTHLKIEWLEELVTEIASRAATLRKEGGPDAAA